QGVDIVVGTPGRIMDLALDNNLRLDQLQKLIIDEFDEILNLGFRAQMTSIFSMMKDKRQNILFSATMTDDVDDLLEEYFDFPEEVSLAPSGTPLENIEQKGYHVPNFNTKLNLLQHLLDFDNEMSRVLIFVNNKKTADLVFEFLELHYPGEFGVLHSNKTQNYRLNAMATFQAGEYRGLVTTDIMARGLDITDITHVINMEFPEIQEQYIHRIGRTGRAEKDGIAISFIGPKEEEIMIETEMMMNHEIQMEPLPDIEISDKLLEFEKDHKKIKMLLKRPKLDGGGAFHEKKSKNQKVNLGGPGKRTPRKTEPRNRGAQKAKSKKNKRK
ncbi:MAG: DEAD/DEAH box helicase, partial [Flavobacterium sp.]